jgi:low temperature requirement protein LtrA
MAQVRKPSWWSRAVPGAPAGRVTTVEVFFDVVFVFTLTQLSRVLEDDLSLAATGRILLLFGILWWMFDGYIWLANHVPPVLPVQKILLFVAMAGFLIAAVGIPRAFGSTGLVFAVGYVVVICVHLLLFTQAGLGRVLGLLAAYNLSSAALMLAGGLVSGTARYALWIAALVMQMVIPYLVPRLSWMSLIGSFRITPGHFVERHGLLVIIALGESVVAIGMGVGLGHVTAGTIAVIVLALALPATLWWTYFTDTPAAEAALAADEPGPRVRLALRAGLSHIPLMLGIVIAAAGIHGAVAHPGHSVSRASAIALAGGVVVFLAGIILIRQALHRVELRSRVIAAVVVLATIPAGAEVSAGLQLALLVVVMVVLLIADRRYHADQAAGSP